MEIIALYIVGILFAFVVLKVGAAKFFKKKQGLCIICASLWLPLGVAMTFILMIKSFLNNLDREYRIKKRG